MCVCYTDVGDTQSGDTGSGRIGHGSHTGASRSDVFDQFDGVAPHVVGQAAHEFAQTQTVDVVSGKVARLKTPNTSIKQLGQQDEENQLAKSESISKFSSERMLQTRPQEGWPTGIKKCRLMAINSDRITRR